MADTTGAERSVHRDTGHSRFIRRGAAAAVLLLGVVATATPAAAGTEDRQQDRPRAAVISPTLSIFSFGAYVGGLTLCGFAAGSITSVANAFPGGAQQAGPFTSQFSQGCIKYSQEGSAGFDRLNAFTAPLAVINPYANAFIEAFAGGLETMGAKFGPALAPFGPTVIQLGATVRFFKGSEGSAG